MLSKTQGSLERRRYAPGLSLLIVFSLIALAIAVSSRSGIAQTTRATPNTAETPAPPYRLPPHVSLTAMPGYGSAPLIVGFFANMSDPENIGFVRYTWNFGDGHVSTAPPINVWNTYDQPGTYMATLTAITADGRSASAFVGVTVQGNQK